MGKWQGSGGGTSSLQAVAPQERRVDVLVEEVDQGAHTQRHDDGADAYEAAEQEADDDGGAVEQDACVAEGQRPCVMSLMMQLAASYGPMPKSRHM